MWSRTKEHFRQNDEKRVRAIGVQMKTENCHTSLFLVLIIVSFTCYELQNSMNSFSLCCSFFSKHLNKFVGVMRGAWRKALCILSMSLDMVRKLGLNVCRPINYKRKRKYLELFIGAPIIMSKCVFLCMCVCTIQTLQSKQ